MMSAEPDEPSSPPVPAVTERQTRTEMSPPGMGAMRAAIVMHLLLLRGSAPDLSRLEPELQRRLVAAMAAVRNIDGATRARVLEDFVGELTTMGGAFPNDLDSLLRALGPRISSDVANRLRREASGPGDTPWQRLATYSPARIAAVLEGQNALVGAVTLSALPPSLAAETLGSLPVALAEAATGAFPMTAALQPDAVTAIGHALLQEIARRPKPAFERDPADRFGAVLNLAPAETRERILSRIEADDARMAERVRRVMFSFADIPDRVIPRDVPRILRDVDKAALLTALSGAETVCPEVISFLLSNLPARRADQLREELADTAPARPRDADAAMRKVVQAIRDLAERNEIGLIELDPAGG